MHPGWLARLVWLLLVSSASFLAVGVVRGNVVFPVHHKFKGQERSLSALKAHDLSRHGRFLFDVDLELGGNGLPSGTGLYFAKIGIGSPSKDYYVQVDTASDLLWVNCVGCSQCPTKSGLGVKLTSYDTQSSSTSCTITCDQPSTSIFNNSAHGCTPGELCGYEIVYEDGSSSSGYYVKDNIHLEQVTGNLQTAPANASVIFGCGTSVSGKLVSSAEAVDGILGLGPANTTLIAQLASAGEVKKTFAHCLDSVNGGGIFVIGEVVEPKVNTTPLVLNQERYHVVLKKIEVGGDVLNLTSDTVDHLASETIIDSGTSLAYFPDVVFSEILSKILAHRPAEIFPEGQFTCFNLIGTIDAPFPTVTLYFEGSLSLTINPQDYLFSYQGNDWCLGFQYSEPLGDNMTLLGDLVLSNRLVLYDLENQTIGWTEYNCSSSIEVELDSGRVYAVGAQNINSAPTLIIGEKLIVLLILVTMFHYFLH